MIKDSGDRTRFESGAVRDMHEGKGRCDLLPMCVLLRLARHYEAGCRKYGDRNWEKGIPTSSFADSAMRHIFKYMDGWDDEDHLIAAIWNLCGLAFMEEKRPEMQNIPARLALRHGDEPKAVEATTDIPSDENAVEGKEMGVGEFWKCIDCGKEIPKGDLYCVECTNERKRAEAQLAAFLSDRCVACGAELPSESGRLICDRCEHKGFILDPDYNFGGKKDDRNN